MEGCWAEAFRRAASGQKAACRPGRSVVRLVVMKQLLVGQESRPQGPKLPQGLGL